MPKLFEHTDATTQGRVAINLERITKAECYPNQTDISVYFGHEEATHLVCADEDVARETYLKLVMAMDEA